MAETLTRQAARLLAAAAIVLIFGACAAAATLEVGPGKRFARIEQANAKAADGDVILVHPREGHKAYEKVAVYVRGKNITFRAAAAKGKQRVKISGKGFDYSGRGSTPRAIFQFNRGTDGCTLEGFELFGAHNSSHNGAGVRINQANHVTIRNCEIHHNDMGIMSNGDGTTKAGAAQRIEHCLIHHNGDFAHPGYNHNLYLGGTSVTLSFCEIHSSLTGHNVKSRAHHTRVEYSYIHHSSNREFDLVDAADTERAGSHAVLVGNIIVKDPKCKGNRAVIHFGRDGRKGHDGTIYLAHNTIVTPFITPVVNLSTPKAKAHLTGNIVSDGGANQRGQKIVAVRNGAKLTNVTGTHNWFARNFTLSRGTGLFRDDKNAFGKNPAAAFADPAAHDYRLKSQVARAFATGLPIEQIKLPAVPGAAKGTQESPLAWQYRHPGGKEARPAAKKLTLGAYGQSP